MAATDGPPEAGSGAGDDTGAGGRSAGDRAAPGARDWFGLGAGQPRPAAPRSRRTGTGPRPGQLSLGDLGDLGAARPGPTPSSPPLAETDGTTLPHVPAPPDGTLIVGRFPPLLPPAPERVARPVTGDAPRPAMPPMTLPPPALPPAEGGPPTLPVYSTQVIERRLVQARPGQTVEVESGEYRGTLTLSVPVHLRCADGEVRLRSTTGPALRVRGCGGTVEGFALTSSFGDAVVVEPGPVRAAGGRADAGGDRLRLVGCVIDGHRDGVRVGTARVRTTLEGCHVSAREGAAVALPEGAVAVVRGGSLRSTVGAGIVGADRVILNLDGVTIAGCGGPGLRLGAAAALWAEDAPLTVRDNHGSGIALGRGGTGSIVGATVTGNGGWGVIAPGGEVTVRGGTVGGNALGDLCLR